MTNSSTFQVSIGTEFVINKFKNVESFLHHNTLEIIEDHPSLTLNLANLLICYLKSLPATNISEKLNAISEQPIIESGDKMCIFYNGKFGINLPKKWYLEFNKDPGTEFVNFLQVLIEYYYALDSGIEFGCKLTGWHFNTWSKVAEEVRLSFIEFYELL